jgi:signal transduction histidine kinase
MPSLRAGNPSAPYRLTLALVLVILALQAVGGASVLHDLGRTVPGVSLVDDFAQPGALLVFPVTHDATRVFASIPDHALVESINGKRVSDLPAGVAPRSQSARALLDRAPGAINVLTLGDGSGRRYEARLRAEHATLLAFARGQWLMLAYAFVGWLYLAIGWVTWRRRPEDGAARGLLELGLAAVTNLTQITSLDTGRLGHVLHAASHAALPFYAVGVLELMRHFSGNANKLVGLRRASVAVACVLSAGLVITHELAARVLVAAWMVRAPWLACALFLLLALLALWVVPPRVGSSPPPAQRARALFLRNAAIISFLVPSLLLLVSPLVPDRGHLALVPFVNLVLLAAFPVLVGWAILQYRLFDLRIVVARGVVVVLLSGIVTVMYLGAVLVGLRWIGLSERSPVVLAVTSAVMVVSATVVQVKLQRLIHATVFRHRVVYARALARASQELAHARDRQAIRDTLERALLAAMGIRRAYLAVWSSSEHSTLECRPIAERPDPMADTSAEPLPEYMAPASYRALARALVGSKLVTAWDPEASLRERSRVSIPLSEGSVQELEFWSRYGLEAIVPLDAGERDGQSRILGFLLLGPKDDGRPLDSEDHDLLSTLASQLAVALENSLAFAEISRLKDGLEREVEERTRELRAALKELGEMQGQLVESEKQAMLVRLVAGLVHELNTPLGALRSSTDTLTRALERLREPFAAEGDVVQRLRRTVDVSHELLELQRTSQARIQSLVDSLKGFVGLDSAEVRTFDVREGLEQVMTLIAHEVSPDVEVVRDYAQTVSPIRCRPERLNHVFLNLIQNALRALDAGGRVVLGVRQLAQSIEITVRDDGAGIPNDKLAQLFEFGFTTKQDGRVGLRLGLPLSKSTVEELGGSLTVTNLPAGGTEARVLLPAR